MQSYAVLVLVAFAAAVVAENFYSSKFDDVDIHQIVDNPRLFPKYMECIIGTRTTGCPQDALEIKNALFDALKTECARCSPKQQPKIKDTLSYICQKQPEAYTKIIETIDPDNKYRPGFVAKFGEIEGGC